LRASLEEILLHRVNTRKAMAASYFPPSEARAIVVLDIKDAARSENCAIAQEVQATLAHELKEISGSLADASLAFMLAAKHHGRGFCDCGHRFKLRT
jgi:hypothetical protein